MESWQKWSFPFSPFSLDSADSGNLCGPLILGPLFDGLGRRG